MYLGRVKHGDWVSVVHSKQSVRGKVSLSSFDGQPEFGGSGAYLSHLEFPLADIPDWSGSHRTYIYDSSGNVSSVDPPEGPKRPYIQGMNDPTVTLIDSVGNKILDSAKMHILDGRIDPSLFVAEIFIGSDVPVGPCILRTSYLSEHASWQMGESRVYPPGVHKDYPDGGTLYSAGHALSTRTFGTWATLHHLEVVPSGNEKGTYINSYVYERPQATFLMGQYDSNTIDFRRNPRK